MKPWLFFPLAALACALLITAALQPWQARPGAPVEAVEGPGGILVLDSAALAELAPTPGFPVTSAPGLDGTQTGPRLVADAPLTAGATGEGARLVLGPQTRARLKDLPLSLELETVPLPYGASSELAVGLVSAGAPVAWVRAPVDTSGGVTRVSLPASASAPLALALWPSVSGEGKGFELRAIRIGGGQP
jgi:hypothetical protein